MLLFGGGGTVGATADQAAAAQDAGAALAALAEYGEADGQQQGGAVEGVGDPALTAAELQAFDPGGQKVDGDDGAPDVEAAHLDLGRPEEHGREHRQQVAAADRRRDRADLRGDEDAADGGGQAGGDQAGEDHPVGVDAGQPGGFRSGPGGLQPAAERRVLQQVPGDQREHEKVDGQDRDAERLGAGQAGERGREAGDKLTAVGDAV